MKKVKSLLSGFAIGMVNALFGAGGGMIAVPVVRSKGKSQKEAQASAIAVILPLCIISAGVYYYKGYYTFSVALRYVPFSIAGAVVGTFILKKTPDKILKKIFSLFMLYLGVRMVIKK